MTSKRNPHISDYEDIFSYISACNDSATSWSYFKTLSESDLKELAAKIWNACPKREFGHGVETYTDVLKENETNNPESIQLICRFNDIKNVAHYRNIELSFGKLLKRTSTNPMKEPLDYAISTISRCGVEYEGWNRTYLWQHPQTLDWHQVQADYFEDTLKSAFNSASTRPITVWIDSAEQEQEFLKQFENTDIEIPLIIRADLQDTNPDAWISAKPLNVIYNCDLMEPNTPFWHCLNILNWYHHHYEAGWSELFESGGLKNWDQEVIVEEVSKLAEAAYEIGRSYEALLKKPIETDALRGKKTLSAARQGGEIRSAEHKSSRESRFKIMNDLVPKIGVDRAAVECEILGLGHWTAIKRQWNRAAKKRDN